MFSEKKIRKWNIQIENVRNAAYEVRLLNESPILFLQIYHPNRQKNLL